MASEAYNPIKKYQYIDALRGIAILMVIAVHISQSNSLNLSPNVLSALQYGAKGVQLFFIVSAFTLFNSLQNRYTREKKPFLSYAIRRFFRIAPMYYLALFVYSTIVLIYPTHAEGIALNAFFIHGWSIKWFNNVVPGGWSIGVEMMFYIILPFIFLKVKNIDQAIKFFILSMVFKAVLEYFLRYFIIASDKAEFDLFLTFYLPNQLPVFSLGIILYFIIEKGEFKLDNIKQSTLLSLVGVLTVLLIFESKMLIDNFISFGFMFLILSIYMSRASGFMLNWPLRQIGKFSFSIYLSHFAIIYLLERLDYYYIDFGVLSFIYRYLIVAGVTTLFSALTYYLIEEKFQNLGQLIIKKIQ